MHPTQLEILNSLRQSNAKQFSELMQDVAETSDNLTYHLKQLQKIGFVDSPEKGVYALAQKGVIYLNNNLELSHDLFPTVSCMLELRGPGDTVLVMKKLKQPYLGKLHLLTFGITSSASLEKQIHDFLAQYHIEAAELTFKAVHRERAADKDKLFIFDKFFIIFNGTFSDFEREIEDRQFLAVPVTKLVASPEALSATKAVLNLGDSNFTEATIPESI